MASFADPIYHLLSCQMAEELTANWTKSIFKTRRLESGARLDFHCMGIRTDERCRCYHLLTILPEICSAKLNRNGYAAGHMPDDIRIIWTTLVFPDPLLHTNLRIKLSESTYEARWQGLFVLLRHACQLPEGDCHLEASNRVNERKINPNEDYSNYVCSRPVSMKLPEFNCEFGFQKMIQLLDHALDYTNRATLPLAPAQPEPNVSNIIIMKTRMTRFILAAG